MKRPVSIGPRVAETKAADFVGIPESVIRHAWQVVGTSVAENLRDDSPMWQVMAACYCEGVLHAVAMMNRRSERHDG